MGIYERIKEKADLKKISINKLEQELGLPRSSVCKYNKNTPSAERLNLIADYLDTSSDYLATGKETITRELNSSDALLIAKVTKDAELCAALEKYYAMSDAKKKHVLELINLLSE